MAKKQGAIHEGSLADGWLKGFNQFMSELSSGDNGTVAAAREKKRRLKRREMYPDMQAEEQKKQDSEKQPTETKTAAPSGTRGEMFDTTQLPSIESETGADKVKKPTAQSVKASAGRLLNPVGAESRGERAPGQSADQGGVHGGPLGEKPAADSETVAMQDTIADLQARLAKMELGGGSTPDYGTPDNPFGAIREPAAPQAVDAFEQSFKNKGGAAPPPGPAGSGGSPHAGYEAAAGAASGGAADDAAIRAAGQQDAASGGGSRGLMAALGSAFSGAKDAITGGPKPGLKPQYKDLTNVELARLERQGIDIYESGVKPLPAMGGALSGGPALGSSMGTPMPPSPAPKGKSLISTWKPSGGAA
jgi:hypothetical protein